MPTGQHDSPRGWGPITTPDGEQAPSKKVLFSITKAHVEALDVIKARMGLRSRSEVIRRLIEDSLNQEG